MPKGWCVIANSYYTLGINAFALAAINFSSDTIKAALISTSYTPNLTTDQYFNIVPGGAVIAAGVALSSKSTAGGACSAANVLWTSVSGSAASYVLIYKDTGTPSTSPLICLIDTASGLPVTPNGGDITCAWSGGVCFTI